MCTHEYMISLFFVHTWEYLNETMEYMGFGIRWREMIHECLSGSKQAVGVHHWYFWTHTGFVLLVSLWAFDSLHKE